MAESCDEFVADDLDDLLAGRERGQDFLSDGLGLDAVDELFDDFEVDVGFEESQTNLFQRLGNVLFGEDGLPAERLEGALEFFLEILKHRFVVILAVGVGGESLVVGRGSFAVRRSQNLRCHP